MQMLNAMHTMCSSTNDNETACCGLVAKVNATLVHYGPSSGRWFESCTRPHFSLALASRFQFPKVTLLRSGFFPHGGDEGGEGGGLVFEENERSQPIF